MNSDCDRNSFPARDRTSRPRDRSYSWFVVVQFIARFYTDPLLNQHIGIPRSVRNYAF